MISNIYLKKSLFLLIFIFFILAGFVGSLTFYSNKLKGRIYPHTYIDSIEMGNKTQDEAINKLNKRNDYLNGAVMTVLYKSKPVATFSAELLQLHRDVKTKVDQAYTIGRTPHRPTRILQQINSLTGFGEVRFYTSIVYDDAPVSAFLKEMDETYSKPPKNALFKFENGKVTSFKAHENGLRINKKDFLDEAKSKLQTIAKTNTNLSIELKDEIIKPEITLKDTNAQGIEELIGEGQSNYSHSIPTRVHNVILAASKFNGVLIPKNEIFSFNQIIGDISSSTGYQPAYIIKNGRTVLGDGGGVCQVSTTVFRAALNSGLPITERTAHAYRVLYYENDAKPGFDATIFSPSVDFKFKNDTSAAILIQTEVDEEMNILKFKFYGKKDQRKIEISPVTLWDVSAPPEPKYEDDPTKPQGQVTQVDFPAWGGKSTFSYRVTNGSNIYEKEFYSSYRPWQAVFLRGTGPSI